MHSLGYKSVGKPRLVRVYPEHNFELRSLIFGLYQLFSGLMGEFVHNQKSANQPVKLSFMPLSHIAYINYISIN